MFGAGARGYGRGTTAGAVLAVGVVLVGGAAPAGAGAPPRGGAPAPGPRTVHAVDLQVPGQGASATRISEAGVVVGVSYTDEGRIRAFRWHDGEVAVLGDEHGDSTAEDVNERGQVLVQTYTDDGSGALLWHADGTVVPVSSPDVSVTVGDLDDAGRVALEVLDPQTQEPHAAVWQDGELTLLDDRGGVSTIGTADALDGSGAVVGTVVAEDGPRAVVWRDGVPTDLPVPAGTLASYGEGVNERGDVLGSVDDGNRTRAVMWERGRMRYLVRADLSRQSFYDVSDRGIAVGAVGDLRDRLDAVVADRAGARVLPTLGGTTGTAYAVNDRGVVVGSTTTDPTVPYGQAVAWAYDRPVVLDAHVDDEEPVNSVALDIDDHGRAVGYVQRRGPGDALLFNTRALLWEVTAG